MPIKNHQKNIIFCDFISSCILDFDNDLLLEEVSKIQSDTDFTSGSRSGVNSWQSIQILTGINDDGSFKLLEELKSEVMSYASQVLSELNLNKRCTKVDAWWINVNERHSYNTIHNHGRSDLIASYYVKAPENSGNFVIQRNDGSSYSGLYNRSGISEFEELRGCPVEKGLLIILPGHLWHYVRENNQSDSRISISYNLTVS